MLRTYAVDSIGTKIQDHCVELACHECGAEPDLDTRISAVRRNALVPATGGAWIVTEYLCNSYRRPVIKKAWFSFD